MSCQTNSGGGIAAHLIPCWEVMSRVGYYRIDLNEIPRKYRASEPLKVTRKSALQLRKEVERFALYFRREFDYPIQEFAAKEKRDYTAYLLSAPEGRRPVWMGACCFRPESYSHPFQGQTLRWIWIHPYGRSSGLLSTAWPILRAHHGDFFVEPPLSPAMLNFILKHNRNSRFYEFYQTLEAGQFGVGKRLERVA